MEGFGAESRKALFFFVFFFFLGGGDFKHGPTQSFFLGKAGGLTEVVSG